MRGEKRSALIFFIIIAFTILASITSFADTTTYQYDDNVRKVRIEHGTSSYSISGIVTDNSGTALSGVTVSLTGASSASTTTDTSGFYRFTGLSNGSYTITPTKTGYTFSPVNRTVSVNGGDVIGQNFTSCGYSSVRLARATPVYYTSLQAAYNAAVSGDIIQSQAITFTENLSINRNITVTMQGGYDCAYTSNSGNISSLKGLLQTYTGGGPLTIGNFSLIQ
jgi:hypothetical protein